MWFINKSWSNLATVWRGLSRAKEFNEGKKIRLSDYNYVPFNNSYDKLVCMFQTRLWHVNNTPYQQVSDKYTNELANLQKELNFLQARLFITRFLIVFGALTVYLFFIKEEEAKDWGDKFDIKFNVAAYGELEEASGEGDTSIDD